MLHGYNESQPNGEQHTDVAVQPEPSKQMDTSLVVLDERETDLRALARECAGLTILDASDKKGYVSVREARLRLKKARVAVQNDGKALRENALEWQRKVIAREKELISIIAGEESRLEEVEIKYETWQEEIRIEAERKEQEFIQNRVRLLAQFNYVADAYDLKIMPEEDFQALLGHAEADFLKEEQRKAEEKAVEEKARKEEQERRRAEMEEIARQRAENEKREAELLAERNRIRAEQEEREAELRKERERLEEERRQIELHKQKAEAEERAKREEQERLARVKREEEERIERDRVEMELREALRPDKEKILEFINTLDRIKGPDMTTPAGEELLHGIYNRLQVCFDDCRKELENI